MIVRVLGDGQYDVPESRAGEFERLDNNLIAALEAGDEEAYHKDLHELIDLVRQGTALAHDDFLPSDAVVPDTATSMADVKALLEESA